MKRMLHLSLLFFLSLGLALSTAPNASAAQSPQVPLNPKTIPQFAQALPVLSVAGGTMDTVFGNQPLNVSMCEFDANILPTGTLLAGQQPKTRVWGYIVGSCPATTAPKDTYLGPVILNTRGSSTDITWVNSLPTVDQTGVLAWKFSTDQTLHWADPLGAEANACAGGIPAFGTLCAGNYGEILPQGVTAAPIPAVVHLHGGEVPPGLDGGPDAWFTSGSGTYKGHGYYSADGAPPNGAIYKYPNSQEAAPIWFHDHALGITRLNVYAGLAGGYIIADPDLVLPGGLHSYGLWYPTIPPAAPRPEPALPDEPTIPLIIQDRMFDNTGQLFFPADSAANILWSLNPEHPYWVPEFVGDTIVVNGKAWPFLNVQAKRYRFLFLNGSNARTYELSLPNPVTGAKVPFYVIGTDGGYLDAPAMTNVLTIMPGERYEVIIDFAGLAGTNLVMKNTGKTPYPRGAQPQGATVGRIIQFRVTAPPLSFVDSSYNPAGGTPIRTGNNAPANNNQKIVRLPGAPGGPAPNPTNVQLTRLLTLNEVLAPPSNATDPVTGLLTAYPGGPIEILVNNTKWTGKFSPGDCRSDFTPKPAGGTLQVPYTQCYSELPQEGDTEIWELVNLTADAHPMHLHAVQFQIINRQNFDLPKYNAAYNLQFPVIQNDPLYTGGVYIPGYGPPLTYDPTTASGNKYGGNPDVVPYLKQAPVLPVLQEQGWKDTVVVMPGMVTRLAVRWAPTDTAINAVGYFPFNPDGGHGYVWHCHIIDHEDNEMMRPTSITPNPAFTGTRAYTNY
jgi:FtsP/CotA-like multicopper oxidase with cupredoxin domain